MAICVQLPVTSATRADADAFVDAMEALIAEQGGPPDGLMVHFARPHEDGFLVCQIWRAEEPMRSYYEQAVLPQLAAAGLAHGELSTWPVWSLARP